MNADASLALAPILGGDRDIDRSFERSQQAPMDGSGTVTQRSARATRENCRHPQSLVAARPVPYRIDAAMDAMKATSTGALGDRALRQTQLD
ncbi:MAG TPA: hypothetical protein VNM38_01000 [Solirubrobacterales bacterium]|nr:hypothetical protein [Solirubrobacterales bacterium]